MSANMKCLIIVSLKVKVGQIEELDQCVVQQSMIVERPKKEFRAETRELM